MPIKRQTFKDRDHFKNAQPSFILGFRCSESKRRAVE